MILPGSEAIFYIDILILLAAAPFWFIRMTKGVLFYVYLWQLKEYHIGRFLDHFRTAHGKALILNKVVLVKLVLFLLPIPIFVFSVYIVEAGKTFFDIVRKRLRKPVPTKKTQVLVAANFLVLLFFIAWRFRAINEGLFSPASIARTIILLDIFLPLIVSAVVLSFQPFAALARNRIIRQASKRRKEFSAQGGSAPGGKNLKVVGITGSYGKTSTKEFLSLFLSKKFKVVKTEEHRNSEVGIAQTILEYLKPEHEIFVCEMGAYNKGGIKLLAGLAQPQFAILTGTNQQHLATFGSMKNLMSAEGGEELVAALPEGSTVIVNGDSELLQEYATAYREKYKRNFIFCSRREHFDVWAEDIKVERESISFKVHAGQEEALFNINLLGAHNIENLLVAIAAAKQFGMKLEEIVEASKEITQAMSAMRLKKGAEGMNIIDSTYSANPDGVIAALEYLKVWPGKRVIVMPCLIELGKASSEAHFRIGEKIGEVCDLAIIVTADKFKELKSGAMSRGMKEDQMLYSENPDAIFSRVQEVIRGKDDIVLLEGRIAESIKKKFIND